MTENRVESVRNELLMQGYANRPAARAIEKFVRAARLGGEFPDANATEFGREMEYLVAKGLMEERRSEIAQAERRYTITAAGVDYVEREGLA